MADRAQPAENVLLDMGEEGQHVNGGRVVAGAPAHAKPRLVTVSQVGSPSYQKPANPGPLGLLGFAITTFVLGLYECGAG